MLPSAYSLPRPAFSFQGPTRALNDFNCSQGMRFVKLLCQSIARTRWSERYAEYPKVLFRDVPNSVHLSVGETGHTQSDLFLPVASERVLKQGPAVANERQGASLKPRLAPFGKT